MNDKEFLKKLGLENTKLYKTTDKEKRVIKSDNKVFYGQNLKKNKEASKESDEERE